MTRSERALNGADISVAVGSTVRRLFPYVFSAALAAYIIAGFAAADGHGSAALGAALAGTGIAALFTAYAATGAATGIAYALSAQPHGTDRGDGA